MKVPPQALANELRLMLAQTPHEPRIRLGRKSVQELIAALDPARCRHKGRLVFDAPALFVEHPRLAWCTDCGCLLDANSDELLAGPADYRDRWSAAPGGQPVPDRPDAEQG